MELKGLNRNDPENIFSDMLKIPQFKLKGNMQGKQQQQTILISFMVHKLYVPKVTQIKMGHIHL